MPGSETIFGAVKILQMQSWLIFAGHPLQECQSFLNNGNLAVLNYITQKCFIFNKTISAPSVSHGLHDTSCVCV